jgi:uncharacterized protein YkwD
LRKRKSSSDKRSGWAGRLAATTIAVLLAALFTPALAPAASTGDLEQLRRHALSLVNRARQQEGLPPLTLDAKANMAAQAHAEDMLLHGYYSHTSLSGDTVRDRYIRSGGSKWRLAAENIARCQSCTPPPITASIDSLQEGWMQSPLHRANILRRGVSDFGFGIAVNAQRGLYAVQVFTGPGMPHDLQPGEQATPLTGEAQLQAALDQINRLRREAERSPLQASLVLSEAARNLLPDPSAESFAFGGRGLYNALPADERTRWQSLNVLAAACGGCGDAPTAADIRDFTQQWLQDERHRATLLAPTTTHLGFAMAANGEGKKTALTVLGRRLQ